MGAQWSHLKNTRNDNTLLPPELVEEIVQKLSVKDSLIARRVCKDWNKFLLESSLMAKVQFTVKGDDDVLRTILRSRNSGRWVNYYFHRLEISRCFAGFWNTFAPFITSIDFNRVSIASNVQNPKDNSKFTRKIAPLHRSCPNLKHLGMTGNTLRGTSQVELLLSLFVMENIESLNFCGNRHLTNSVLLSVIESINALKSLNLSGTGISFLKEVEGNSSTPGEYSEDILYCGSDKILSFQFLWWNFFATPKAAHMKELILNYTSITGSALGLLANSAQFHWESVGFTGCKQLEPSQLREFAMSQKNLNKFEADLGISGLSLEDLESVELFKLEYLSLHNLQVRSLHDLDFLRNCPQLTYLNHCCLSNPIWAIQGLKHVSNLRVLKLGATYKRRQSDISPTTTDILTFCLDFGRLLPCLVHLRELTFNHYADLISDKLAQLIIEHLPQLEVLGLPNSSVTDLGLAGTYVDKYDIRAPSWETFGRRVKYLRHVSRNPVPGLSLANLKNLRALDLSNCASIGEATWHVAIKLPSLISLNLAYCSQLSQTGMMSIIASCRNLEEMNLLNIGSHVTSAPHILKAIKSLKRIRMPSVVLSFPIPFP